MILRLKLGWLGWEGAIVLDCSLVTVVPNLKEKAAVLANVLRDDTWSCAVWLGSLGIRLRLREVGHTA
jgi:hypothetical protein